VQEGDWNVAGRLTPNHNRKPFGDPHEHDVGDRPWRGAPGLSKIAIVHTVGGIVFRARRWRNPQNWNRSRVLARYRQIRAEAKRLLKRRGPRTHLRAPQPQCRPALRYVATWLIDEWSKIGCVTRSLQAVVRGRCAAAFRRRSRGPGRGADQLPLDVQGSAYRSTAEYPISTTRKIDL
jgi:hypothetical protein